MFKVFYSVYSSVTLDAYLGCIDTLLLRQIIVYVANIKINSGCKNLHATDWNVFNL